MGGIKRPPETAIGDNIILVDKRTKQRHVVKTIPFSFSEK